MAEFVWLVLASARVERKAAKVPLPENLWILVAGFFAAAMNSVAGGGTMLTFPALIAAGLPLRLANTTSTVALFLGTPGSVWAYRRQLRGMRRLIIPLSIVSFLGGTFGGILLLMLSAEFFAKLVPWLVLFATFLFVVSKPLQRWVRHRQADPESAREPTRIPFRGLAFQALVAIYGGYFGAGIGIMMLAGLGVLGMRDIHRMNALKALLGMSCKIGSVIWFVSQGAVDWNAAGWLIVGSVPGYYFGSHFAQQIPPSVVRGLVVAIGISIAAGLLLR